MKAIIAKLKLPNLPTVGMFSFALASTWSLYQFFNNNAIHPTWLYAIPAALVEIVTAWLTGHLVESVYQLTRSNALKQDLRFNKIIAIVSTVLVAPTFIASIVANRYEFQGQFLLALLFPVAVMGCAIGAQIPRSVKRHKSKDVGKDKAKLRKVEQERDSARATIVQHDKRLEQMRIDLAQDRQFKETTKDTYAQICKKMNGDKPRTEQQVQRALVLAGHWPVSGGTARNWAKIGEAQ